MTEGEALTEEMLSELIKPFADGTVSTLKVMCSVECSAGEAVSCDGKCRLAEGDGIIGIVPLTGRGIVGSVGLWMPDRVFLALMNSWLGESYSEVNEELEDGAAELLNVIFGQAKRILNQRDFEIEQAIPTIIRGSGVQLRQVTQGIGRVIPFQGSFGEFRLQILLGAARPEALG